MCLIVSRGCLIVKSDPLDLRVCMQTASPKPTRKMPKDGRCCRFVKRLTFGRALQSAGADVEGLQRQLSPLAPQPDRADLDRLQPQLRSLAAAADRRRCQRMSANDLLIEHFTGFAVCLQVCPASPVRHGALHRQPYCTCSRTTRTSAPDRLPRSRHEKCRKMDDAAGL